MSTEFSNLNEFFSRIKSINFWQRVFGWAAIRSLSYEAYQEFSHLVDKVRKDGSELADEKGKSKHLEEKILLLQKSDTEKQKQLDRKDSDIKELNHTIAALNTTVNNLTRENTEFKQTEKSRRDEYQNRITQVNTLQERLNSDINRIQQLEVKKETERFEKMRLTWLNHESSIEN